MRVIGCQGSAYSGQREASIADGIRAVDYHAVLMCRLGRCLWETSLSSSLRLSRANVRAWATEGMSQADGAQRLESEGSWKDDLSDSHRRVRGRMLKSSRVGYGGDADGPREFADGTGGRVVRREEQRIGGGGGDPRVGVQRLCRQRSSGRRRVPCLSCGAAAMSSRATSSRHSLTGSDLPSTRVNRGRYGTRIGHEPGHISRPNPSPSQAQDMQSAVRSPESHT